MEALIYFLGMFVLINCLVGVLSVIIAFTSILFDRWLEERKHK